MRSYSLTLRAVSFALVAAASFVAGIMIGGTAGTPASVAAHLPLIGDGLDPTPDPSADFTDFWKAWNALNSEYVITHASSTLPSTKEKMWGAIAGLTAAYGDPYTVFFPPEEAKQFAENISGSFAGVGMEIDVKDGILTVIAPLKGTPAEAAGILPGDKIVAIDGKTTEGISTEKAVTQIRGEVGTVVTFTLNRDGKQIEVKVTRALIQVPETDDGIDAKSGVYHIALYEFTANSAQLFNDAFIRFKKSGATLLVLDLRGNPGGYLEAAVNIASHFLPKGAPVVTEDFGDKEPKGVHTSIGYNDMPRGSKMVVLVDAGSASASEILAGALQDTHVATVIGTNSFGKGSVQQLIDVGEGSLKVTVARWVTPAGHWIMDSGIKPDIAVERTRADVSAKKDPQMDRAIQFLTTGK
ncbi:MAG TPA: S41 family peptidase [Candidatus Paceibacterota bacterium]|nr:S41 family peptidase [Candidatus Paceibacterota bacterium]